MNGDTWKPGDRVQWKPDGKAAKVYGALQTGTIANAAWWPAVDDLLLPGSRVPVDLDTPVVPPERHRTHEYTITRLYVREEFLEPYSEETP